MADGLAALWSGDGTAPGGYFVRGPLPASVGSVVRDRATGGAG